MVEPGFSLGEACCFRFFRVSAVSLETVRQFQYYFDFAPARILLNKSCFLSNFKSFQHILPFFFSLFRCCLFTVLPTRRRCMHLHDGSKTPDTTNPEHEGCCLATKQTFQEVTTLFLQRQKDGLQRPTTWSLREGHQP